MAVVRRLLLALLPLLVAWGGPGFFAGSTASGVFWFVSDFEATGCANEGQPQHLVVHNGSPNCDASGATCPDGSQCAVTDAWAILRTPDLAMTSPYCIDVGDTLWQGGGRASWDRILTATVWDGSVYADSYPQLRVQFSAQLELRLECSATAASPSIPNGITGATWRRQAIEFDPATGRGCLISADMSDYQNSGQVVCCEGAAVSTPTAIEFGDFEAGFAPDTRWDDFEVKRGKCWAPVLREEKTAEPSGVNTSSFALTAPAGTQAGDLLIAVVGQEGATDCTLSGPAGWTAIAGTTSNGSGLDGSTGAFWKIATVGDEAAGSFTFTSTCSTREWLGTMHRFAQATFDDTSSSSWLGSLGAYVETAQSATSMQCQSLSGLPEGSMVLRAVFWATGASQGVTLVMNGATEDFEITAQTGGNANASMHGALQEIGAAGTAGSITSDPSGSGNYDGHCWTIPIKARPQP